MRKVDPEKKMIKVKSDQVKNELVDTFKADFDKLVEKKSVEFGGLLTDFAEKHEIDIEDKDGKVDTIKLENFFFRALSPIYGVEPKYSPPLIDLASEFFWDCVEKTYDKGIRFIPTIQLFCAMIGISSSTLNKYAQSTDGEMRQAVARIKDRFISFYTSRGMKREISEVMSIFTLKAAFGMRDNEQTNITYNDNKIIMSDDARAALLRNVERYKSITVDTGGDDNV